MKDFNSLKGVGEENIKTLDCRRQALYYERFLTAQPPEELKSAPVRSRASLLRVMARHTVAFFLGVCLLIALVLVFSILLTGGPDPRLLLLVLPVGAGILTVVYRTKLRGFFSALHTSTEAKLEKRFENRMGKYAGYLSQRDKAQRDYETTVMDEKTASGIIDACITARGLAQLKSQFGIKEDELLVFRYIKYPSGGIEKTLDGVVLCQKYKVQYAAITKDTLCEISGIYDIFEDLLLGSGASSCLIADIDRVDLRGDDTYATQFYCVVASGKDTMFLPAKSMLPLKRYTISSFTWSKTDTSASNVDTKASNADYVSRTRRELEKNKKRELDYDEFDKIRSLAYTVGAGDVDYAMSDCSEEEHRLNLGKMKTLVERSLNVMIQEKNA
ncbi:MAG: hypothetical protein AB9835_00825 [Eubacteriales bacterium]